MKKHFLTLFDLTAEEIEKLLNRSLEMKSGVDVNKCPLIGKSIGLLFEKASTRTRVSFEVGIYQLGAHPVYLTPNEIQLGRGETISDTAKTLSRYLDAVVIRTFGHKLLSEFASASSVPVINGLSDLHHPCQVLSDMLTILENKGRLKDINLAYIGDGNNVANSLVQASALMGINLTIACPEGYEPNAELLRNAKAHAKNEIKITRDPQQAVSDADAVYTDVWVSMGQEQETKTKKKKLKDYQINSKILSHAKKDAIVLHCLPAHRGEEITDEIMDGTQSVVFTQAENRLHAQKALLEMLLGKN
ncbi:MAG: ornithine carbamoyltransferase [Nitrospiraceae bacterium]|nr:ornithine carbamoyltransferase [Nitrospiraceae bacterium]